MYLEYPFPDRKNERTKKRKAHDLGPLLEPDVRVIVNLLISVAKYFHRGWGGMGREENRAERERERERERDRDRERQRQRERETGGERETETETERVYKSRSL